jgi:hypothetical protein
MKSLKVTGLLATVIALMVVSTFSVSAAPAPKTTAAPVATTISIPQSAFNTTYKVSNPAIRSLKDIKDFSVVLTPGTMTLNQTLTLTSTHKVNITVHLGSGVFHPISLYNVTPLFDFQGATVGDKPATKLEIYYIGLYHRYQLYWFIRRHLLTQLSTLHANATPITINSMDIVTGAININVTYVPHS